MFSEYFTQICLGADSWNESDATVICFAPGYIADRDGDNSFVFCLFHWSSGGQDLPALHTLWFLIQSDPDVTLTLFFRSGFVKYSTELQICTACYLKLINVS